MKPVIKTCKLQNTSRAKMPNKGGKQPEISFRRGKIANWEFMRTILIYRKNIRQLLSNISEEHLYDFIGSWTHTNNAPLDYFFFISDLIFTKKLLKQKPVRNLFILTLEQNCKQIEETILINGLMEEIYKMKTSDFVRIVNVLDDNDTVFINEVVACEKISNRRINREELEKDKTIKYRENSNYYYIE